MRNAVQFLAAIALAPMLSGPAIANPAGGRRVCLPVKKAVAVKVRNQVIVKERLVVVEKPVIVRDAVSYLATIIPSNTYNTTVTLPQAPAVQQAQLTASFGTTQVGQVQATQQYGQTQQYLVPQGYGQQQYAAQGYQQQQAQQAVDVQMEMVKALKAINERLCKLEGQQGAGSGNGEAARSTNRLPSAFAKCATCHSGEAKKGGEFVMFDDKGVLAHLSERDLRGILSRVGTGEMPPPQNKAGVQPLTQAELAEMFQWANRQK